MLPPEDTERSVPVASRDEELEKLGADSGKRSIGSYLGRNFNYRCKSAILRAFFCFILIGSVMFFSPLTLIAEESGVSDTLLQERP